MTAPAYTEFNDEELVNAVRENKDGALTELLTRYRPFVVTIASHYFGVSLETDDIVQEGMLALLSAAYSYLPDKSAAFRTYSAVCISNRIRSLLRAETGKKNEPLNTYISLDKLDIPEDSDPVKHLLAEEEAEKLNSTINTVLSPLERRVLACVVSGMTYRQAADSLGISEKSVNNALQRLRNKLKTAMEYNRS